MFMIVVVILGVVILKDMIVDQLPDYILQKLHITSQFKSV